MSILLAIACAHLPPASPRPPAAYAVTSILAAEDHVLTSSYTVEVSRGGRDALTFRTTRSKVVVEEGERTFTWDSAAPDPAEPWVVTQERALSAVPVTVRLDRDGRPVALADEPGWRAEASAALEALSLPALARSSAEALLDADGVILGLVRDFPGLPPQEGRWERAESVAGRRIVRTETCEPAGEGTLSCTGTAAGPGLEDGTSRTTVRWDADGLVELDARWDAVAVANAPGGAVARKIVAGRRRVTRISE